MKLERDLALPALTILAAFSFAFGYRGPAPVQARPEDKSAPVRLGYFPNVTHAPALIGVSRGFWSRELGAPLDTKLFNAGPEAMEALLAGEIDLAFVGPSPAINTYVKSQGRALRVIAGVAWGGASLIRRADVRIDSIRDLANKRVAVPQLGGTQDVSCRTFLAQQGLKPKEAGGNVTILPVKNSDILTLFKRKQLDAAWVPEPWAARIKAETGAQTVADERKLWPEGDFISAVLVARTEFADQHPGLIEGALLAHRTTLDWINSNPAGAMEAANHELKRLSGSALAPSVLQEAWSTLRFTDACDRSSLETFARAAQRLGYLREEADLQGLVQASVPRGQGPDQ